jgi:hypothetical protein
MSLPDTSQSTTLKTFASVLLLAVGLLWSGPAAAQDGTIVSVQSQEADSGQAVDVPVEVTDFNNVGSFTLVVNYDPDVLSLSESEGLVEAQFPQGVDDVNVPEPGELRVVFFTGTGESPITLGDGTLLDITFSEFSGGTTELTFGDDSVVNDETATAIDATFQGGVVGANLPTFSVGSATEAGLNQTVSVPLSGEDLQGVGAASVEIAYDQEVLEFEGIANDNSGLGLQAGTPEPGVVSIGGQESDGVALDSNFVEVEFSFYGGSSALTVLGGTEISDTSATVLDAVFQDGSVSGDAPTVSFADRNVRPGETVSVPVQASEAQPLGAASVVATFDPSVLTFVGTSESIVDGLEAESPDPGVVNIGFTSTDGVDPANNDGKLVDLRFEVSEGFTPGNETTLGFVAEDGELASPEGTTYNTTFEGATLTSFDQFAVDVSRDFGDASAQANYELVALPGDVNVDLAETVSGTQGPEWRAFREVGAANDGDSGLEAYDGSDAFSFQEGRAFWVISQNEFSFQDTVSTTDVSAIDLQDGWNAISNPLRSGLDWQGVQSANGLDEALFRWDGGYEQVDSLSSAQTGEGYYVFNSAELDSLSLEEVSGSAVAAKKSSPQTVGLTVRDGEENGSSITAGIGSEASTHRAPPAHFASSKATLRILGSGSDSKYVRMVRPVDEETTTFNLVLSGEKGERVTLEASGLSAADGPEGAVLVNTEADRSHDLQDAPTVTVQTGDDGEARLTLHVGSSEVNDIVAPDETELRGNYPNPFSQQTTVELALSEQADVKVQVYNVLGQKVATVADGEMTPGTHKLDWDGSSLSSGVYFVRMEAGSETDVHKVTVVR